MKILTTGKGKAGSWAIRGDQLGRAMGASVMPNARLEQIKQADVVLMVKRINSEMRRNIEAAGVPWVWDLVDFYPQPQCGAWSRAEAIRWVRMRLKAMKPSGVVYPNERMREDVGVDGEVVYHHARRAPINPIRPDVRKIGYEGEPKFLGVWRERIQRHCARRGWVFAEGAPLHEVDAVVALRDGLNDGYVQRHWKSNVKLANAHGTGTPFIGSRECGYTETATGHELWVDGEADLIRAFDALDSVEARQEISEAFKANTITLQSRAQQMRSYLERIAGC